MQYHAIAEATYLNPKGLLSYMHTTLIKIPPHTSKLSLKKKLALPAQLIREGRLVVFPTETVYGLGADALNADAVKKIFVAKGRPQDNPLIVHIADKKMLSELVQKVPKTAEMLIRKFWPGPLTIILKRKSIVPDVVVAGGKTVAVRMPADPIARELIRISSTPLAAPSANLSGKPSPTLAKHVIDDMGGRVDCIIDGGDCRYGLESTVIDLTGKVPLLLRPGAVTLEQLRNVLGKVKIASSSGKKPRCPGMKYRHYSPCTRFVLVEGCGEKETQLKMRQVIRKKISMQNKVAVICFAEACRKISLPKNPLLHYHLLGDKTDLRQLAHEIFRLLRELDHQHYDLILMGGCSEKGIGLAIMNRLRKAAHEIIT